MALLVSLWVLVLLSPAGGNGQAFAAAQRRSALQQSSPKQPPDGFPLRAINIVGNQNFPTEEIIAATGLRIGSKVRPADFQRAMAKLRDTGVFESLEFRYGPQGDGYQVTFQVKEPAELYAVRFAGLGVPDEQLHELLKQKIPLYGKKVPATGPMVKIIGNVLQRFWIQQGNKSKIVGRLVPTTEDQFQMVFEPPSAVKTIAFVTFENTGELSPLELQRTFNQAAMGVPFSQPRLKELLDHNVRPLYEEKGRLGVTFCPCSTEPDTETQGVLVKVHVEQGPIYTFGTVRFAEGIALDTAELSRRIKFQEGETADMGLVQQSLAEMEALLKANGYLRVFTRFDREVNDTAKTVDVVLDIRPGDLYTFNKLTITGLDIIGEAAVKKRWGLKRGDPFNDSYPNVFLKRVAGMFDNLSKTDSKTTVDEQKKTVDVELLFK